MNQPTDSGDLGPMPESTSVEPQLWPGGVDADPPDGDDAEDAGRARDLDPDRNPGVDDAMPDEISAEDDKSQEPNGKAGDSEAGTVADDSGDSEGAENSEDGEPDAGQEAEDGSVEPPA